MDFTKGLLVFERNDKIFAVVDRLSKYEHFMGIKKQIQQNKLDIHFVNLFTSYMVLLRLWTIEMPNSKVISRRNFSKYRNILEYELCLSPPNEWTNIKIPTVKNHLEENQKVIQILKENLVNAQNRIKQQANQHRLEREFVIGFS